MVSESQRGNPWHIWSHLMPCATGDPDSFEGGADGGMANLTLAVLAGARTVLCKLFLHTCFQLSFSGIAANGERIANQGEVRLTMKSGKTPINSTLQVSKISKPLWSVGKLCDAGYRVEFQKGLATVTHESTGKVVSTFPRQQGLYVGKLQLRCQPAPTSFPRPT